MSISATLAGTNTNASRSSERIRPFRTLDFSCWFRWVSLLHTMIISLLLVIRKNSSAHKKETMNGYWTITSNKLTICLAQFAEIETDLGFILIFNLTISSTFRFLQLISFGPLLIRRFGWCSKPLQKSGDKQGYCDALIFAHVRLSLPKGSTAKSCGALKFRETSAAVKARL